MGDGLQFNSDDEPVFDSFGLPKVCDADSEECCDPCEELLFCLRRAPIELHLPGIDISRWIQCISFACSKLLQSSGIGGTLDGGGEDDVFNGVFLALSANETIVPANCGVRGQTTLCQDAWADDAWGGGNVPITHTILQGRTIYAPGADGEPEDQTKPLTLALRTECVLNDEEVQCVKFTVLLVFGFARIQGISLGACEYDGISVCDPALVAHLEAEGWGGGELDCVEIGCCPLAESELIPLAGRSLADLDDVTLTPVEPPDWQLIDEEEPDGPWELVSGNACGATRTGFIKSVPYDAGPCTGDVLAECGANPLGRHELGNVGCEHPEEGDAAVWTYVEQLDAPPLGVWVPPPITMNSGDAFLKVLATSCRPGDNCGSCVPDPEKPNISVPVEFTVQVSGGTSCSKTYTPAITECVTGVKIYWPWGVVTDDLDPVAHIIKNRTPGSATHYSEESTIVAIDDRGCVYCTTVNAACGCCEGLSGSLEISVDPESGCEVTLTAHISGNEECPQAYIEILRGGETCPALPEDDGECTCEEMFENDPGCASIGTCAFGLGDGQSTTFTVTESQVIKWRIVDGPCGCGSEWAEFPIYCGVCACCLGTVTSVQATISNWDLAGCPGCGQVNKTYHLEPLALGFNCQWRYGYFGGVGDGDSFSCDESEYGIQLDYVISCDQNGLGDPAIYELRGILSVTAGGTAGFESVVIDAVEFDDDIGDFVPGNCAELSGLHTLFDPVEGVCNPSFAAAFVVLEVG